MSQKMYFIAINFFWTMWHQNLESLTFLRPTKQISSVPCKKRNFKVLVFKSRRSLWGHAWCHKKCILLTFKGICMNFSLELKKITLSHPVTSKQPHKIVQIHMRHPVDSFNHLFSIFFNFCWWNYTFTLTSGSYANTDWCFCHYQ